MHFSGFYLGFFLDFRDAGGAGRLVPRLFNIFQEQGLKDFNGLFRIVSLRFLGFPSGPLGFERCCELGSYNF